MDTGTLAPQYRRENQAQDVIELVPCAERITIHNAT